MLVQGDAVGWLAQQAGEPRLAILDRQSAQILAVEFEQIKSTEHGGVVVTPRPDQLKHCKAGVIGDDGLAVDQAGARRQVGNRHGDEWKPGAEVVALARKPGRVCGKTLRKSSLAFSYSSAPGL